MSIIDTNQPNFFGNNGEVLADGYIYIGLPNQEPIAFPKTVTFTDAGGTETTAVQPLRTNAQGCIQFNGNAIKATADGDYSMLRLDSTGTQIKGGYTPLVEADASSQISLDNYTENGLLLADVKQLDKTPGQTVRSIGKLSEQDGLGALWLVVIDTGNPADDIDLIDFDNGTQGERIKNYLAASDAPPDRSILFESVSLTGYNMLGSPAGFYMVYMDSGGFGMGLLVYYDPESLDTSHRWQFGMGVGDYNATLDYQVVINWVSDTDHNLKVNDLTVPDLRTMTKAVFLGNFR